MTKSNLSDYLKRGKIDNIYRKKDLEYAAERYCFIFGSALLQ